jgi:hypothetical protein
MRLETESSARLRSEAGERGSAAAGTVRSGGGMRRTAWMKS